MNGVMFKTKSRVYTLKYGLNSLIEVQEISTGIDGVLRKLSQEVDLDFIRLMFYFGLKGSCKEITLQEVGSIVDEVIEGGASIVDVCDMIQRAICIALGLDTDDAEQEVEEQTNQPKKA